MVAVRDWSTDHITTNPHPQSRITFCDLLPASILLRSSPIAVLRIRNGQKSVAKRKNRLKEIQDQLDILMDELHRLRHSIHIEETRRRSYPFPFERASVSDDQGPRKSAPRTKH